ncbi:MAG: efflux RND transporter periplasmic adaptor subunit [Selenomonadaceae bacterium]|nr:efflux RND transporter periplasmic adaptor subunit [Selenomonadaceae bacterium]
MKKYFFTGVALIIILAVSLIVYGAWLNYSDTKQIAKHMNERTIAVPVAKVAMRNISPKIEIETVRFSSDNMADAVALTDGRIVNWLVKKNDKVTKGQILISMTNEQIPLKIQQAMSQVSQEEAILAQTYASYQRQLQLLKDNATSKEKFGEAEANYYASQEKLKAAKAQLAQYQVQNDWLFVKAPIDGEVLIIYQYVGASVKPGEPVALIGDFNKLTFSLNLTDNSAQNLKVGDTATLTFNDTAAMGKAYGTEYGVGNKGYKQKIRATLREIMPDLNLPADIRRSVWEVDNGARILEPMTYTGVVMDFGIINNVLTVPLSAMTDTSYNKVFVVDENDIIHLRTVVTGANDDVYTEIISGLSEGETVVTDNVEGLEDGMKIKVIEQE